MSSSSSESLRLSNCARFLFCDSQQERHLKLPTTLTYPDPLKVVQEKLLPRLQSNTGFGRKLRFNLLPRLTLPLPSRPVKFAVSVIHNEIWTAHVWVAVIVYSVLDELLRTTSCTKQKPSIEKSLSLALHTSLAKTMNSLLSSPRASSALLVSSRSAESFCFISAVRLSRLSPKRLRCPNSILSWAMVQEAAAPLISSVPPGSAADMLMSLNSQRSLRST